MRSNSVIAMFSFASLAQSALPPGAYNNLRIEAVEAVIIDVVSVNEVAASGNKEVTLGALVIGVERSKAGQKKGDAITIKYSVPTTLIPEPIPTPILEKNVVYPAFLKKAAKGFEPAAYGLSFKMTPEA